jgi:citrate lyase beta subunit
VSSHSHSDSRVYDDDLLLRRADDIAALSYQYVDAISVGKIETPEDVQIVSEALAKAEKTQNINKTIFILPWIETAKGVLNVREIIRLRCHFIIICLTQQALVFIQLSYQT